MTQTQSRTISCSPTTLRSIAHFGQLLKPLCWNGFRLWQANSQFVVRTARLACRPARTPDCRHHENQHYGRSGSMSAPAEHCRPAANDGSGSFCFRSICDL